MSQKYLFNGGTGDFERLPGTENDKLTLGEQMLLKPELNLMNTELNLNQARYQEYQSHHFYQCLI